MARYKPLQMKYNTQIATEIKDFLPIISNAVPNKRLWLFDEAGVASGFAFAQVTGTATGALNYNKAYHGNACYKITLATNSSAALTVTPTAALNLLQLGETVTNNYSSIKRVMKYGDAKDKAHFALNVQKSNSTATTTIQVKLYNGAKTATSSAISLAAGNGTAVGYFEKMQLGLNDTDFTYAGGFADADLESVTKIDIIFNDSGAAAVNYYIQDIFSSLPKASGVPTSVSGAAYTVPTATNYYYVSSLFGSDADGGMGKISPKKTIEGALAAAIAAGVTSTIIILDSEIYKYGQSATWEDAASYTNTSAASVSLMAAFLESPTISSDAGLYAPERCGARLYNRANFSETTNVYINQTTGNDATGARNDAAKPFKTLQAGVTAATSGDVVTITDSATYNELVTVDDHMTIQAGAKCLPILKYTGGNTALTFSGIKTVTIDGLTIQGNGDHADVTVSMLATTTLIMKNCTFSGTGDWSDGTNILTDGALTLLNSNFINNSVHGGNVRRIVNAAGGVFILNCKSYDTIFYYTADSAATVTQYIHLSEFLTIPSLNGNYRVSIKGNKTKNITVEPTRATTFIIQGNYFYNSNETVSTSQLQTIATSTNGVYLIKNNFFNLKNSMPLITLTGIFLSSAAAANTQTVTITKNIFTGCSSGLNIGIFTQSGNYTAQVCDYNYFIGLNIAITTEPKASTAAIDFVLNYSVFDTCNINIQATIAGVFGAIITENYSLRYLTVNSANAYSTITTTNNTDLTTSNFSNTRGGDLRILPTSPILTTGAATWLGGVTPIFTSTGLNLALAWLSFAGSGAVVNLNTAAKTVSAQYCNFDGLNYALALNAGSISAQNCNFINCGTGLLQNAAALTAHTVKYNVFENNITGALITGGIDFEYNTLSENSYGVYNAVAGLGSLYDFALQYLIIKNNIITKSIIYDYTGSTPTDYNMISKRSDTASAGLNDIDSGSLLDGAYLYPAIIPLGYYSNDEAYGGSSAGLTVNMGARYLQNIKSTLSSSNYVFASTGSGANIWAYENPNKFKYNLTPVNLSSTRTLAGDYNASATGYAKEWTLAWLEAGTEGRINAPLKAALEVAYESFWIIGLSFDNAATYTYYKVKKENSLQSEQVKYIFDTLPEGSATLILIEIPLFNILDYTVTVGMT